MHNNNNTSWWLTSWWLVSRAKALKDLHTDPTTGLSQKEAAKRLKAFGPNTIAEPTSVSPLRLLIHQFASLIILILIAACIIAGLIGAWIDALVIAAIVIINAFIGFFQEYGAEQSLAALRRMTKPLARVLRERHEYDTPSRELVPGDIVILEAGDVVPADGRLIESHELGVDEASLTGESIPVTKIDEALSEGTYEVGDLKNMAFMGTLVVKGRGHMVVTNTGHRTKFGQIAQMIAESPEGETTLQKQLKQVGYVLIACSVAIASLVMLTGYLQGVPLLVLLFTSLSLFIAAVPEGLPAVITVALARGVKRMAKRHALIRRLASVETLGSISFICTDKTGTITQNRMVVTDIYAGDTFYQVTGTGLVPEGEFSKEGKALDPHTEKDLMTALQIGVLCNSATLEHEDNEWVLDGDPTEGALLTAAGKAGLFKEALEHKYPLLWENPFDSKRQSMSILREVPSLEGSHGARLFVKGAGDAILNNATHRLHHGKVIPLTEEGRKELEKVNSDYAKKALRVIALGYRDGSPRDGSPRDGSPEEFKHDETDETNLVFVGFLAMIDPPRPEVRKALHIAQHAGIRTIMLTGDHKETARAIGKSVGLIQDNDQVLTGKELATFSDEQLVAALYTVPVYARISFEHKMRIVTVLKQAGERVAMTGDGVNDAPALKLADIGIAMGITGTDVAKEAADMIITDDNYASIVSAIQEGRGMYESLVKFVRYMLPTNLAELLVILWGTLGRFAGIEALPMVALLPVQLLWINLVTDGIPAIALVFDPLHKGLMRKKPSAFRASLVGSSQLKDMFGIGLLISLGVMVAYFYGVSYSPDIGRTMAFTTLVMLIFIQLFLVRAEFKLSFFSNPLVLLGVGVSMLLQVALMYVPFFQVLFHTVPLEVVHWEVMMGITVGTWLMYGVLRRVLSGK